MSNDERNPNDQIRNNPPAIAPSSFELLDSFVIRLSSFVICGSRKGKRFPMNFSAPPGLEAEIDELITHYPQKRSASLMALHAVQEHFGWISRAAMEWVAQKLELNPSTSTNWLHFIRCSVRRRSANIKSRFAAR